MKVENDGFRENFDVRFLTSDGLFWTYLTLFRFRGHSGMILG